jgi:hypothetical protein
MRRALLSSVLSLALVGSIAVLAPTALAATTCLPDPGAACAWSANNYLGTKFWGDPSPNNGQRSLFPSAWWNTLHSFKNRSPHTACPMNKLSATTWEYLDLILPTMNDPMLPDKDHRADAVWFGNSAAVDCF